MSITPDSLRIESLPADAVQRATKDARRDGVFAGLTAGLLGAIIGSRMGLNRNKTILAGVLTGALAGYHFTQGFIAANISQVRAEASQKIKRESAMQEQDRYT